MVAGCWGQHDGTLRTLPFSKLLQDLEDPEKIPTDYLGGPSPNCKLHFPRFDTSKM